MKNKLSLLAAPLSTALLALPTAALADDYGQSNRVTEYAVTVTNLTYRQQFTPLLVVSHKAGVKLFALGAKAGNGLEVLAEEGNTAPLTAELTANPGVNAVTTTGPLLNPGESRTMIIPVRGAFDHISVASMLIPTNDAFFAVNGVQVPRGRTSRTEVSVAYDAGSESNDELCLNIPGPDFVECGGPGGGQEPDGGEGFVHVHRGIHGIGDLNASSRDWRNPVARITIQRVR